MYSTIRTTLFLIPLVASTLATPAAAMQVDTCAGVGSSSHLSPVTIVPFDTTGAATESPGWQCDTGVSADLWFCVRATSNRSLVVRVTGSAGCPVALEFFGTTCPMTTAPCISCWVQTQGRTKGELPAPMANTDYYYRLGTSCGFPSTGTIEVYEIDKRGTNYCMANPNSKGVTAVMCATGPDLAATNDFRLAAADVPAGSFGFFLVSPNPGFTANPGGSSGNLCLGGQIGRFVGPGMIQMADASCTFGLDIDLNAVPTPTGTMSVGTGDTRYFQAWYRDSIGGVATSNFTDGLEVTFQ